MSANLQSILWFKLNTNCSHANLLLITSYDSWINRCNSWQQMCLLREPSEQCQSRELLFINACEWISYKCIVNVFLFMIDWMPLFSFYPPSPTVKDWWWSLLILRVELIELGVESLHVIALLHCLYSRSEALQMSNNEITGVASL